MTVTPDRLTREERRARSAAAILEAARALFAELGYEKATIRGVAARAGVDPALVMQHFGNKEGLFAAAARWTVDHKQVKDAAREDIARTALDDLFRGFEDEGLRYANIALMRNCLTHDTAREVMRDDVMCDVQEAIADRIGGEDGELRAGLLGATMIGVTIARYLLEIPAVKAASREDLERVLLPLLEELVEGG